MKNTSKNILTASALIAGLAGFNSIAQAAIVTWDGGGPDTNWTTSANWDGNGSGTAGIPGSGDTVNIDGSTVTVTTNGFVFNSNYTINLTGGADLNQSGGAVRFGNSTMFVGAGSNLGGGFWDMDGATIHFQDGASANMTGWENKDGSSLNFILGSSGFTTLTPGAFYIGNGNVYSSTNGGLPDAGIQNASYSVDMTNYTGGIQTITLVDYGSDSAGVDNTSFQTATLEVNNAGGYTAALQWNDSTEAIELNVTAIPEPGTYALIGGCFALSAVMLRRRRA